MTTVYPTSVHSVGFRFQMHLQNAYSADIDEEADPFEERAQCILRKLRGWIFQRYGSTYLDDMLQEAHIRLWQNYQARPLEMDATGDGLWFTNARFAAKHAYWKAVGLHHRAPKPEGSYTREAVVFYASDLITDDEQDGDEMLDYLAADKCDSETREIEQADARLEVERILEPALAQLGPKRRRQVQALIEGVLEEKPYLDIGYEQGWSKSTTKELVRLMRRVLYMAATGESYEASEGKQSPVAREAEAAQARRLRARGYSLNKIGAVFGKSKAWAQQATEPQRKADPQKQAAARAMKADGATWKQVGKRFGVSASYAKQLFK